VAPRTRRELVAPALPERVAGRLLRVQGPRHAPVPGHPFAVDGAGGRALRTIDTGLEVPDGSRVTQQDEVGGNRHTTPLASALVTR